MTHFFQTRFRRCVTASAVVLLALAVIIVSALSISSPLAEAGLPKTVASQAVSSYNDDVLFRHGLQVWHEKGYDGMTSGGDRLKVGIIDAGVDGWRMSARQGLLPEPPDLDENDRVKVMCWIRSNGSWESSNFNGCEAPNHANTSDNTHGTSVRRPSQRSPRRWCSTSAMPPTVRRSAKPSSGWKITM